MWFRACKPHGEHDRRTWSLIERRKDGDLICHVLRGLEPVEEVRRDGCIAEHRQITQGLIFGGTPRCRWRLRRVRLPWRVFICCHYCLQLGLQRPCKLFADVDPNLHDMKPDNRGMLHEIEEWQDQEV
jgi:hypothetical protein